MFKGHYDDWIKSRILAIKKYINVKSFTPLDI